MMKQPTREKQVCVSKKEGKKGIRKKQGAAARNEMGELLEPARQKWSLSYNFTIVGGSGWEKVSM